MIEEEKIDEILDILYEMRLQINAYRRTKLNEIDDVVFLGEIKRLANTIILRCEDIEIRREGKNAL